MRRITVFLLLILCSMLFSSCITLDSHAKISVSPSEIKSIEIYHYKENFDQENAELLMSLPADQFQQFYDEFNTLPCYMDIILAAVGPAPMIGYVVVVTPIDGYKEYYNTYMARARGIYYFDYKVWNAFVEKYIGEHICPETAVVT